MSKLEPVIKYLETIKDTVLDSNDYNTLVDNIVFEHDVQMTLLKSHARLTLDLKMYDEVQKYKIQNSWNEHVGNLGDANRMNEIMEILRNDHSKKELTKKFNLLKMFYDVQETNFHVQIEPVFKPYNTIDIVLTMRALTNIIELSCNHVLLQSVCVIIMYDELMNNFNFVLDNMDFSKILCEKLKMFTNDEEIVDCFDELSLKYGLEQKFYVGWNEIFETLEFNTE